VTLLLPFRSPNNVREISVLSLLVKEQEKPDALAGRSCSVQNQWLASPSTHFVHSVWSQVFIAHVAQGQRKQAERIKSPTSVFDIRHSPSGLRAQNRSA
jgi:hypothetical protein